MAWESAGLRIRRENQRGEETFRLNGNKTKLCIDSNISNLNNFGKDQTQMLSGIAYNSALNYMPDGSYFANVFYIPSWKNYGVQLAVHQIQEIFMYV